MKKGLVLTSGLLAAAVFSASVFATTTNMNNNQSCKTIRTACMSAGYTKHDKNGKNVMANCIKPILSGQDVANVTVDPNDVKACQAKTMKHMKKMKAAAAAPTTAAPANTAPAN